MGKSVGLKQCEVWRVSSFQLFAFKLSATWSNYFFICPFVFKKEVMAHTLTRPWTLQRKSWMLQSHFLNQMSQHYVTSWIIIYGEIQYILNHKLKNSKSKAPPAVHALCMENRCVLLNHFLNQMSQHQLHTFWTSNSKFTCLSFPPRQRSECLNFYHIVFMKSKLLVIPHASFVQIYDQDACVMLNFILLCPANAMTV